MKCERPFFNAKKHGLNRLQFTMCGRMIHTISPVIICLKNIIHLPPCQVELQVFLGYNFGLKVSVEFFLFLFG
jgi:hypothetical protein